MIQGFDIYTRYQTVKDFAAAKQAGYAFCYVKASDGLSPCDTDDCGKAGTAAGIAMGAYHYAQKGDPVAQADVLIERVVADELLTLAPALDLEAPFQPGEDAAAFAVNFLRQVANRGHQPCLYGDNSMLETILPTVKASVPDVIVWAARYGAVPTVDYDVWQYSASGQVPGIDASAVDLDKGTIPYNHNRTG